MISTYNSERLEDVISCIGFTIQGGIRHSEVYIQSRTVISNGRRTSRERDDQSATRRFLKSKITGGNGVFGEGAISLDNTFLGIVYFNKALCQSPVF